MAEQTQPTPRRIGQPLGGDRSRRRAAIARLSRRTTLAVRLSLAVFLLLVLSTLAADVIAPQGPSAIDLRNRLQPPAWLAPDGAWQHPLGTDATGRDVLSRVLHGGRVSLVIGVVASIVGLAAGTLLGLIGGYIGGLLDQVIMFLVDVQLSLPFILLAVAVALVLGTSFSVLIGIAALSTWPASARVVRGVVLSLRDREFTQAAQALGADKWHIMRHHLLPNLLSPILVLATLSLGRIILLESGLSFLGIGVRPPTPSWGNMIYEGRDYLNNAWWLATAPGVALMLLAMSVGTIGDWLRDVTDVTVQS